MEARLAQVFEARGESLQDRLSNKRTRGPFDEIRSHDIVQLALPSDRFTMQATPSNGRQSDCPVHLSSLPGPIAIDAKFPLEPDEAQRNATSDAEKAEG